MPSPDIGRYLRRHIVEVVLLVIISFDVVLFTVGVTLLETSPQLGKFVLVISAVSTVAFSSLFLCRRDTRANVVLTLVSVACGFFLFNLALEIRNTEIRPINPLYQSFQLSKEHGIAFDTRSPSEVILNLRQTEKDVYPAIGSLGLIRDFPAGNTLVPIGGIARVTTVLCNESGPYVVYKSDRFGFNNSETNYHRAADVLLVGDSYMHGYCVDRRQSVAGNLDARGMNAITVGISGNGPLLELATLVEYGAYLKPKHVVWVWYQGNDLDELRDEIKNPVLTKYLQAGFSQNLVHRQNEVDAFRKNQIGQIVERPFTFQKYLDDDTEKMQNALALLRGALTLHKTRLLLSMTKKQYLHDLTPEQKTLFRQVETILLQAKKTTERWGGKLYFVYLPPYNDSSTFVALSRETLQKINGELNIPFLDFDDARGKRDEVELQALGLGGHHLNAEGYKVLADQIYQRLTQKQILLTRQQ